MNIQNQVEDSRPTLERDLTSILIFCAVLLICLLVYAGHPFVIDDLSLLASAANLGSAGASDINVLAYSHWSLSLPGSLGEFGPTGDYYAKKSPAPAWMGAILFRLGSAAPWLNQTITTLMLSPLLTAGTAALLYSWGRRMNYSRGAVVAGSLLFGGATMALVYSRFLLGEPVMMFGLTLAAWAAHRVHHREKTARHPHSLGLFSEAALCGLGLGLAAGGNVVLVLMTLIFALYLWRRDRVKPMLYMLGAVAFCLSLLGLYNFARFGTPLQTGYHFDSGEGFTTPVWVGLYGLLASPGRGLLWFNPLTWLALPGWVMWRRREPRAAWLALAVVGGQILIFSMWWAWPGGWSWGPRFLLATIPFLTVAMFPVLERARRSRMWFASVVTVSAIAASVQLIGALTHLSDYNTELSYTPAAAEPTLFGLRRALTDPAFSAIIGQARYLFEQGPVIAWYRNGVLDWVSFGALVIALGCVLWAVIGPSLLRRIRASKPEKWRAKRRNNPGFGQRGGIIFVVVVTGLAANVALSRRPGPAANLQTLSRALTSNAPGDVLLLLSPELGWVLTDLIDRPPAVGLPPNADDTDPAANALFDHALEGMQRVWILTNDSSQASHYENRLHERGTLVYNEILDGYRLTMYALAE
jgi:hypothetical protein